MSLRPIIAGLLPAAALAAMILPGQAQDGSVKGRWKDSDGLSEIQIAPCGNVLCGTIVWLKEQHKDERNPDPALRGRPLLGVRVLSNIQPAGGRYSARGYNPEDGRTYDTTIELQSADKLQIKGCVLGGLICDDDIWTRTK